MKKVILSFVLIMCCAFCFAGCDNSLSATYWEDTSKVLTEFFEGEEYQQLVNLEFCDNIIAISNANYGDDGAISKQYAELNDVYKQLFEQSVFSVQKYAKVFTVIPTNNNGDLKSSFKKVNSSFDSFKQEVQDFLIRKSNYEKNVQSSTEEFAKSQIELDRLNIFKFGYLDLINKAYELSLNVYQAYTIGYHNFYDYNNINLEELTAVSMDAERKLAIDSSNLQLVNSAIKVLNIYLKKEINNNYNNYWQISKTFYSNLLKYVYENDINNMSAEEFKNKFTTWKNVYDDFCEDAEKFNNIVSEIKLDVLKECNFDALQYATITKEPLNQGKVNFFMNYYKNVEILYNHSLRLLNLK